MVGSDIGQSIAFEIIDSNFYSLFSQISFNINKNNYTLHHHCFRFPVAKLRLKITEIYIKDKT
jgi:hypothetical protein